MLCLAGCFFRRPQRELTFGTLIYANFEYGLCTSYILYSIFAIVVYFHLFLRYELVTYTEVPSGMRRAE